MTEIKCICGKTFKSKFARGAHYHACQQWRDYIDMMAADPDVQKKLAAVKRGSITKMALAKELGITVFIINNLLKLQDRPAPEQIPVGSEMVVELTPQQVIQALRSMIEEHAAATKAVAELKASLEDCRKRLIQVSADLTRKDAELKQIYERQFEPIKFRLAREAVEQQRESH